MERALDIIREITFILIALETFAVMLLLIILSRQVLKLIKVVREGLAPILQDAQSAARTTKATADFVGEHIVQPTAEIQGKASGLRRTWQVLFGDLPASFKRSSRR